VLSFENHMRRNPIDSSAIASVGYDPEKETLEVEFQSGNVYRYSGVPEEIYDDLLRARSKGRFFGTFIRGQYDSVKQ
jgi:hypothetical protein